MPTGSRGSSLPAPPLAVRRRALSPAVMTVFSLVGAALVVASNSAVTPLYRLYQQSMHLTPLMITLVYAVYTFSLLAALKYFRPLTELTAPLVAIRDIRQRIRRDRARAPRSVRPISRHRRRRCRMPSPPC